MDTVEMPNSDIQLQGDILQHLDNIDLTTIDRNFPVLAEGPYVLEFVKFEPKENKNKTGHNLIVHLKTTQPAKTEDGKDINPNFPIQDLISLVKTEKYNPAEKLADIQLACFGEQRRGFRFTDFIGHKVLVRLTIDEENEAVYGRRNKVRRYVKLTAGNSGVASL